LRLEADQTTPKVTKKNLVTKTPLVCFVISSLRVSKRSPSLSPASILLSQTPEAAGPTRLQIFTISGSEIGQHKKQLSQSLWPCRLKSILLERICNMPMPDPFEGLSFRHLVQRICRTGKTITTFELVSTVIGTELDL
jgi:hypothetical protein